MTGGILPRQFPVNGMEEIKMEERFLAEIHEECGVFGVYHHPEAVSLAYFGLHALQHRGQEGAGIAASDGQTIRCVKGKGLLSEVFQNQDIRQLCGENSVGHVRYATAGGDELENVQPIVARAKIGCMAVAHNGQIVNADELRQELEENGNIFHGSSDSEIILHLIQREQGTLLEKLQKACRRMEGAFSFVLLTERSLYAVRDKNGLRPLALAALGDGYCISSETCAFQSIKARYLREVAPGEIIKLSDEGLESFHYTEQTQRRMCAMEYIYFARPDSDIEGINVHTVRKASGRRLAEKDSGTLQADIVVGVPDSSVAAAMGYSERSGLPYEVGLIKNRYVGRTFIEPTQEQRDLAVRMKLSANLSVVEGKRIVLLDDSIVRGTTIKRIVALLREAGAKEVHVRIASPEMISPCFYGVDTSTRGELISATLSCEELRRRIQADSIRFLTVEDLKEVYQTNDLCFACFDGNYVTPVYSYAKQLKPDVEKRQSKS